MYYTDLVRVFYRWPYKGLKWRRGRRRTVWPHLLKPNKYKIGINNALTWDYLKLGELLEHLNAMFSFDKYGTPVKLGICFPHFRYHQVMEAFFLGDIHSAVVNNNCPSSSQKLLPFISPNDLKMSSLNPNHSIYMNTLCLSGKHKHNMRVRLVCVHTDGKLNSKIKKIIYNLCI